MRTEGTPEEVIVDVESEAETERLGRALGTAAVANTVIGLVGGLGAGKTRLCRAIAGALGVDRDEVLSPTFVLIHEYDGDLPVFHFDAYRLGGPAPFEALGAAEYWEAGGVCLVEWADLVAATLPNDSWRVTIETSGAAARRVTIAAPAAVLTRVRAALLSV